MELLFMVSITNALTRFAYVLNGWKVVDQRGSIFVLRRNNTTMMCHGIGTIYSIANKDDYYTNNYWDLFAILPGLYERPRVLMIGLGGGTIARQLSALYSNLELDVVEIDGDIAELAKEHFDIGGARVIVGDGAKFVKESDSRYDLIILDAFEGSKIPKAFTSQDFFTDSYKLLSSDGIIAINSIEHTVDMGSLAKNYKTFSLKTQLASGNSIMLCSKRMSADQIKGRISNMHEAKESIKKAYALME